VSGEKEIEYWKSNTGGSGGNGNLDIDFVPHAMIGEQNMSNPHPTQSCKSNTLNTCTHIIISNKHIYQYYGQTFPGTAQEDEENVDMEASGSGTMQDGGNENPMSEADMRGNVDQLDMHEIRKMEMGEKRYMFKEYLRCRFGKVLR
jgi:hypothetical protein